MLFHAGKGVDIQTCTDESVAFQTSLKPQKMRPRKIPGVVCIGL